MQRSSDSIASLAAALAKAQIELSNPEKSLVGTIEAQAGEGAQRLFRYAPLSSGLEIVRKTLGQHEIATVQTTALDQSAGIINLTTVLAHSSGEWIASDWPVCAIADTATPHRMGAALTYARRYALFTLVGIAGEDDLDAPDLITPAQKPSGPDRPRRVGAGNGRLDSSPPNLAARTPMPRHGKADTGNNKARSVFAAVVLSFEASARLRDQMLSELNDIGSGDEAAKWAHRRLPRRTSSMPPMPSTSRSASAPSLWALPSMTPRDCRSQKDWPRRKPIPHRLPSPRRMRRSQNGGLGPSRSTKLFFRTRSRGASAIAIMCALWRSKPA